VNKNKKRENKKIPFLPKSTSKLSPRGRWTLSMTERMRMLNFFAALVAARELFLTPPKQGFAQK